MLVMVGRSSGKHCFRSQVGMGSNPHDVDEDSIIIFLTDSSETIENLLNTKLVDTGICTESWLVGVLCSSSVIRLILSAKKPRSAQQEGYPFLMVELSPLLVC